MLVTENMKENLLMTIMMEFFNDINFTHPNVVMDMLFDDDEIPSGIVIVDVYSDWHMPYLWQTIKDMHERVCSTIGSIY